VETACSVRKLCIVTSERDSELHCSAELLNTMRLPEVLRDAFCQKRGIRAYPKRDTAARKWDTAEITEVLEDNSKKRAARIPFPLCSTTSFSLLLNPSRWRCVVENCRTLSKSVDTVVICRRMSYHSRTVPTDTIAVSNGLGSRSRLIVGEVFS
jgi:hypothetical protein